MLDGSRRVGTGDLFIAGELAPLKTPVIKVLNKVDLVDARQREAQLELAARLDGPDEVLPLSARSGEGVQELLLRLCELMPEGPRYYPEDMWTDQPEAFLIAELIREKAMDLTREEVPFNVAVLVEEIQPRDEELIDVRAFIYVAADSQKGIIIGKGGRMLKEIGSRARHDIEALLGNKIFLDLRVKVEKDWARRPGSLHRLGY